MTDAKDIIKRLYDELNRIIDTSGTHDQNVLLKDAEEFLDDYKYVPVRPVADYCHALETWYHILRDKNRPTELIDVKKSNLLARMIYGGEQLRERPCPVHSGKWMGIYIEPCPGGCDVNDGNTCGWIPNDLEVLDGWGWTIWLAFAIDENMRLSGLPSHFHFKRDSFYVETEIRAYAEAIKNGY